MVTLAPLVFLASSVCSLPIWTRLARGLGKDRAMRLCMLWAIVALGVTPIVMTPDMSQSRMLFSSRWPASATADGWSCRSRSPPT
jgi:hypothetical protein